ncbi:hypothetical protein GQX74_009084 [Glossina fuscipes]|nr:hypothetical protein GQX74_009084 [Glossina fuscipes]
MEAFPMQHDLIRRQAMLKQTILFQATLSYCLFRLPMTMNTSYAFFANQLRRALGLAYIYYKPSNMMTAISHHVYQSCNYCVTIKSFRMGAVIITGNLTRDH